MPHDEMGHVIYVGQPIPLHGNTPPVTVQPSVADVTALVLRCEGLERERDEARGLARRLHTHNLEMDRALLTSHPPIDVQELTRDRDRWRGECLRERAIANQLDAGNASLRQENEQLRERVAELERRIVDLRKALNLAWEWSAKYPLQGAPSAADRDAANAVYEACCAVMPQSPAGAPVRVGDCEAVEVPAVCTTCQG